MRILPWHNHSEEKNNKYICIKNVVIQGMAFEPGAEGVEEVQSDKVQSTKVLMDGQILIVRPDGSRYTVTGVKMEK